MWWTKQEPAMEPAMESNVQVSAKQQAAVAVEEPPPLPTSYEAKPEMNLDEMAEYLKVASAIGLDNSEAMFNERMRQCCSINGLRIYNNSQVVKFLNFKLGRGLWQWLGLRNEDVDHLKGWTTTVGEQIIKFGDNQYGQQVPLPVLLTVQRVIEDVPNAHFYVSGIPGKDDDPFLLVASRRSGSFIIERWDEPDFREV